MKSGAFLWTMMATTLLGGFDASTALAGVPGSCAELSDPTDPAQQDLWEMVTSEVDPERELLITDLGVVNDPSRTWDACGSIGGSGTQGGEWTFGAIMTELAGSQDPATFTQNWLSQWLTPQTINGYVVPARTSMQNKILDVWPKTNGKLNMNRAPFRLLAVVNRMDLRNENEGDSEIGSAGEGRLIYGFYDPTRCLDLVVPRFTVIVEFGLPVLDPNPAQNTLQWAQTWNTLEDPLILGGNAYNDLLADIVATFATRDNLHQVRTNDFFLVKTWELREFHLSTGGALAQGTVTLTPDDDLNNTEDLVNFLNFSEASILENSYELPPYFLGGSSFAFNRANAAWGFDVAAQINNNEARHIFAINTCNGCHSNETSTNFQHVLNRKFGNESNVSDFLTGGNVNTFDLDEQDDPVDPNTPRNFNELDCRALGSWLLLQASPRDMPPAILRSRTH